MENASPKHVTQAVIEGLIQKVKLPAPDEFSQDWEYEVADCTRITEFLCAYEHIALNRDEKFALMIIIISSFDDAIVDEKVEDNWPSLIKYHLLQDRSIHKNTIDYWAMLDEDDLENGYAVTPFMREIAYIVRAYAEDGNS